MTVMLPGSTVTWVLSANVLITVTLTVTHPLAARDPPDGATLTLPAMAAGTSITRSQRMRQLYAPPGGWVRSASWAGGWKGIQTSTLVPAPSADLSMA